MTETKNVPAGGGTPTGTGTETAAGQAAISYGDFTTGGRGRQVPKVRVADFLGTGEKNGQTMKQLKEIYPGDSRSIRAQIEKERRTTPILSGQSGYYLPACEDEVRRFDASMKRRARAIWTSTANVMRAYGLNNRSDKQLEGQIGFLGGDND